MPVWKITTRLRGAPGQGDAERLQALVVGSTVQTSNDGLVLEYRNYAVDETFALLDAADYLNAIRSEARLSPTLSPETSIELVSDGPVDPREALGSHVAAAVVRVGNIVNQAERLRMHIEAAGRHSDTLGRDVQDRFATLAGEAHTLQTMVMELIQTLAEVESGSRG